MSRTLPLRKEVAHSTPLGKKVAFSTPLTPFETPSEWGFTRPVSTISIGDGMENSRRSSSFSFPSPVSGRQKNGNFIPSWSSSSSQHRDLFSERVASSSSSSWYVTALESFASSSSSSGKGKAKNMNMRRRRGGNPPPPIENLFDKFDNDPSFTGGVLKCREFVEAHFGKHYAREKEVGNHLQKRYEIRDRFFGDGQPAKGRNRVVLDPFSYMTPPRIEPSMPYSPSASSTSGCSFL